MLISNLKKTFFLLILFISLDAFAQSLNVLKLSCEYNPNLIKKKTKSTNSSDNKDFDSSKICKFLSCTDTVEVNKTITSNSEIEYRLRNSWFDHQGILLDDFLITKETIMINTFVSQAYFLESYMIDRVTGKTKRTFYRFDDPDFFYNIKKLQENSKIDQPVFNKKGKLSLKTINSFSLEPWETFYFEGKCLEGSGV